MDLLRWILLGVGTLIVIGVYVWSRRDAREEEGPFVRAEPGVGHDDDASDPLFATPSRSTRAAHQTPSLSTESGEADLEAVHRELSSLQELLKSEADEPGLRAAMPDDEPLPVVEVEPRGTARAPAQEEKLLVLYLVAPPRQVFAGADLAAALEEMGMIYSADMHIYHRYPNGSGGGMPVFGVANLVEPGTLEIAAMAATGTPGLTLFLQLPGPMRPLAAFDLFAGTAQRLAARLGGELRDQSRSALSRQTLEHLRDEVRQYELRLRLPAHA
ncbi:MAG: cell division protein ZipA [Gammaproteobacteria bacterium]